MWWWWDLSMMFSSSMSPVFTFPVFPSDLFGGGFLVADETLVKDCCLEGPLVGSCWWPVVAVVAVWVVVMVWVKAPHCLAMTAQVMTRRE